jgi:hypothetical protein
MRYARPLTRRGSLNRQPASGRVLQFFSYNRLLPTLLFAVLVLPSGNLLAQAARPGRNVGKLRPINNDAVNVYLPSIRVVLTSELHFVKKVCSPNENQFNDIHRAGRKAILSLAQTYVDLKRKRAKPETWPSPNESIEQALVEAVGQFMPAAVAKRYSTEIAARMEARRAADAATIVTLIDRQVMLDPDQQREIFTAIRNNWKPYWSRENVVFFYPQYATLPDPDVLSPHLSDSQQRLWSYLPKRRSVSIPWQLHFNANEMFDVWGPEEFPDPDARVDSVEPK